MNLDLANIQLQQLITHQIGNKVNEEPILLSDQLTEVGEQTLDYLMTYFLKPFEPEDFYQFTHSVDLHRNDVYALIQSLFAAPESFVEASKNLGGLLYEASTHPKIKAGTLNVAFFEQAVIGDEVVEAIGLFKSENQLPFLQMQEQEGEQQYLIQHEFGFDINKMDKACLIFNTDAVDGYRVLAVDQKNKSSEAQILEG